MAKIRIRFESSDVGKINQVVGQLLQMAQALNLKVSGPVPLPKKKLRHTVRRTPCGDGSDTYETWEKRIYRRLVIIEGSDKDLKQVLRIVIPEEVSVKISVVAS